MVKTFEGRYRDGKIELLEQPPDVTEARVLVTFLAAERPAPMLTLAEYGISEDAAAEARSRLASFADDWERPDMDVYDAL